MTCYSQTLIVHGLIITFTISTHSEMHGTLNIVKAIRPPADKYCNRVTIIFTQLELVALVLFPLMLLALNKLKQYIRDTYIHM